LRDPRYITLLGACLTQFTVIGMLFTVGLFIKPFEAEFGWSRTLVSASSALAFFMMGTLAMVGGRLNDRFGPRPVLAVAGLAYGLGFVLMSRISEPWHLLALFGTLIGVGLSTHDVVTLSTIARWFQGRRGIMSGVVKSGTALGQIAVPPTAALLIAALGWRSALVVLGLTAATLLLLAAFLMQRPPERPRSSAEIKTVLETEIKTGTPFATARRSRIFWTLCAIQFLFFPVLMSIPLHLPVHGIDLGLSAATAATLLSVIGAASIAGRLILGALTDRIGGKNAYTLALAILLTSMAALTLTTTAAPLFAVVALYGFAHGALFVVVSPTAAEYFGMRAHGAIFGTVLFFGTLGGALGPIVLGVVFDRTGSYQPAFIALTCAAALALVLARSLPRP